MNCPFHLKGCGGCSDIEKMYGDTLRAKDEMIKRLFPQAQKILGAEKPLHYRNKVIRTFANGKQALYSGIYKTGTHQIISVKDCLLQDEKACKLAFDVTEMLAKEKITAYREDRHQGILRHMQIRRATRSGEILLTLVTGEEPLPNGRELADRIRTAYPEIRGVMQNINSRDSSAVFGFQDRLLSGRDELWDQVCGLKVCLSSRSFYQVNTPQAEKLYDLAVSMAELQGTDNVLDAYSGIGIIGMRAAREAGQVTGIELVKPAVRCAENAARVNRIENIRFECGDARQALIKKDRHYDCVFVDPPRSGCTEAFLQALIESAPEKIVYISCFPQSLRRDMNVLEAAGWKAQRIRGVDLFPFTEHVETVCLLSKEITK